VATQVTLSPGGVPRFGHLISFLQKLIADVRSTLFVTRSRIK
jgi:hypothetical protein